jgi:toxin-antitoxin system PIN domain toxin
LAAPPVIAVDTNLLIYAHRASLPEHRSARRAIERAAASEFGWGIAFTTLAEFWSVVTHPAASRPSTVSEASAYLASLFRDGGAELWLPGPAFGERLLQHAVGLGVRGARVFDLQIALTALEHGAREMWTHDRGFLAVPGLRVHDPLAHGP